MLVQCQYLRNCPPTPPLIQIDEDALFELVRTKPGNKTSYEPPSVEKKTQKKEKAETEESLSQGKDQFEGICVVLP